MITKFYRIISISMVFICSMDLFFTSNGTPLQSTDEDRNLSNSEFLSAILLDQKINEEVTPELLDAALLDFIESNLDNITVLLDLLHASKAARDFDESKVSEGDDKNLQKRVISENIYDQMKTYYNQFNLNQRKLNFIKNRMRPSPRTSRNHQIVYGRPLAENKPINEKRRVLGSDHEFTNEQSALMQDKLWRLKQKLFKEWYMP